MAPATNYAPSTLIEAKGKVEVMNFDYIPFLEKKVEKNEILEASGAST